MNVVGLLRGTDPVLRDSVVLVDAHYDHLGIGPAVNGDSNARSIGCAVGKVQVCS